MNANGVTGNGWDFNPVMNEDGTVVAFVSTSNNLDPMDTVWDGHYDVYVRNLATQTTLLLSKNRFGTAGSNSHNSTFPSISSDGSVIVFDNDTSDLVARDWNGKSDVFVAEIDWNAPALPGDYSRDGVVDAADYSVWRDAVGRTGITPYSGADGDGDGDVDQDDYGVWKVNFGRVMAGSGGSAMGREGGVARESAESTSPPAEPGAVGRVPVVAWRAGLGNQSPALPGVWWTEQRISRVDSAEDTGRDVLRRQPIQRSAAVVDRALVAWVTSRAAIHEGASDTCDAATRQRDESDAAEWDAAFDMFAKRGNAVSVFASIDCE